jgi:hypothetical protein
VRDDSRDRALGEVLDREVGGLQPTRDQLAEIRSRGAHRRVVRWTAIGTALAVFVGALGLAAAQWGDRGSHLATASSWKTFGGRQAGWTIRYPAGWDLQAVDDRECAATTAQVGAFISNVPFRLRHSDGGTKGACNTDTWVMAGFPSRGVGLEIEPVTGIFGPQPMGPDTRFPMRLTDLRYSVRFHPGGPRELYTNVLDGGQWLMNVRLYMGPRPSQTDRALATRMLASLRLVPAAAQPRLGQQCASTPAIDPVSLRSRPVVGDVDGDGHRDGVWTVDAPGLPQRCSRFVVVFRGTKYKTFLARLPEWWAPQLPRVAGLADIDAVPGSEVVATFDAGGFSLQTAIFSVRDGRLVPLRLPEMFLTADAQQEAANLDCAGGPGSGEIVWATTGSRRRPLNLVLRRFYRLIGSRFQLEPRKTERMHVPRSWIGTNRVAGFAPELVDLGVIFPSCSATR